MLLELSRMGKKSLLPEDEKYNSLATKHNNNFATLLVYHTHSNRLYIVGTGMFDLCLHHYS